MNRLEYDFVFHLGLGVYDCFDKILIERGAVNTRVDSRDAAGNKPANSYCTSHIEQGVVLQPHDKSHITRKLRIMDGHLTSGGYHVYVAEARLKNSYICNETNYDGICAMNSAYGQGKQLEVTAESKVGNMHSMSPICCVYAISSKVYFLHIPYPYQKDDRNYTKLADAGDSKSCWQCNFLQP
jgi:hypothetical protein